MTKLMHRPAHVWVAHAWPPIYRVDEHGNGQVRIAAAAPGGDPAVFAELCGCLGAPLFLLYILHTSRGEGEPGRYQSQEIDHGELAAFLTRFAGLLANDGRFDLWAYSPEQGATVVWDRHNYIFAYGERDCYVAALHSLGFAPGELPTLGEHIHHYRAEFDADARALLESMNWIRTPLRPEDEQR